MHKHVIFSDLDGTLLDHNSYSFGPASQALGLIKTKEIPLVLCTSKTRGEIEYYRDLLDNKDPFISENGAAIFIPGHYFSQDYKYDREMNGYKVIELGTPRDMLIETLKSISDKTGVKIRGFSQMTAGDIGELTGLDELMSRLAMQRDYSEPFIFDDDAQNAETIEDEINLKGYKHTRGGRFHHILGGNDKGRAVKTLTEIYKTAYGEIKTVGIGDSLNDLPMLEAVEIPVLVQKPGGEYDRNIKLPNLLYAEGAGPVGWNLSILKLFMNYD